jgi:hypothetical protein
MRDLQHLEELSSTAALGLWADDVVLALDQTASGAEPSTAQATLLAEAAETLEEARKRTVKPLTTPKTARALAATETALTAVATMVRARSGESQHELLDAMVRVLRVAAEGKLRKSDANRVQLVIELFGMVGEHQLAASNSVLRSRKEARAWTEAPATANSS